MKFRRFLLTTKLQGNAEAAYALLEGDTGREIAGMPWRKWTAGNRTWPAKECRLLACCAIRYILRAHNFAESRAFR